MPQEFSENNATDQYLVYKLGEDVFATPLIEIRGVIEYHAAKPIPHTAPFYKGVINIRGEILGVIDLRERLGIQSTVVPTSQLVFETEVGAMAASVDRVLSVSIVVESEIDRKASTDASAASQRPYFLGVAKLDGAIITLVSLRQVVAQQKLTQTNPSTEPA